jgi:hypothetical protein
VPASGEKMTGANVPVEPGVLVGDSGVVVGDVVGVLEIQGVAVWLGEELSWPAFVKGWEKVWRYLLLRGKQRVPVELLNRSQEE